LELRHARAAEDVLARADQVNELRNAMNADRAQTARTLQEREAELEMARSEAEQLQQSLMERQAGPQKEEAKRGGIGQTPALDTDRIRELEEKLAAGTLPRTA